MNLGLLEHEAGVILAFNDMSWSVYGIRASNLPSMPHFTASRAPVPERALGVTSQATEQPSAVSTTPKPVRCSELSFRER
jgi:hypothetical protein